MADPAQTPDTTTATKPGFKTSEFWLTAITSLIALFNSSGAFHFQIPVDMVTNVLGAIMTYVASRSVVKAVTVYAASNAKPVDASKLNQ